MTVRYFCLYSNENGLTMGRKMQLEWNVRFLLKGRWTSFCCIHFSFMFDYLLLNIFFSLSSCCNSYHFHFFCFVTDWILMEFVKKSICSQIMYLLSRLNNKCNQSLKMKWRYVTLNSVSRHLSSTEMHVEVMNVIFDRVTIYALRISFS